MWNNFRSRLNHFPTEIRSKCVKFAGEMSSEIATLTKYDDLCHTLVSYSTFAVKDKLNFYVELQPTFKALKIF